VAGVCLRHPPSHAEAGGEESHAPQPCRWSSHADVAQQVCCPLHHHPPYSRLHPHLKPACAAAGSAHPATLMLCVHSNAPSGQQQSPKPLVEPAAPRKLGVRGRSCAACAPLCAVCGGHSVHPARLPGGCAQHSTLCADVHSTARCVCVCVCVLISACAV
jgi:hypothetical protein